MNTYVKKSIIIFIIASLIATILCFTTACSSEGGQTENDYNSLINNCDEITITEDDDSITEDVDLGYVVITDFVANDGSQDVTATIQNVIDQNPNKTIYFPDGTYILSSTLKTSANPKNSVSFVLSDFACLKASENWSGGALISFGGGEAYNSVTICGSNYGVDGGVFDGNGVANGIEIASGRETSIKNASIKHTVIGILIDYGVNSGSSDADIRDCNIIGNDALNSVGIQIDGYDNTIANVRIGHCQTGVILNGAGNSLSNVHPLFNMACEENYDSGIGFLDKSGTNTYYYCYSDQYRTGFCTTTKKCSIFTDCYVGWWSPDGGTEIAFYAKEAFNSLIIRPRIQFSKNTTNTVLKYNASKTNTGSIQDIIVSKSRITEKGYETFFSGNQIES